MTEAVKFAYGGSEVTFYKDEIFEVRLRRLQPNIIHRLMNGKPVCYFTGASYRIVEIDFDLNRPDTMSKINTLRSQTGALECYYRYGVDTGYAYSVHVQMMKADVVEPYGSGRSLRGTTSATFVESETGTDVSAVPIPLYYRFARV